MLVGFSKHSQGRGAAPVNYLVSKTYKGEYRNPPPVVLRGNPGHIRRLIDSLDFEHVYTSGVLSFAPGEVITPEMEDRIIEGFEEAFFAGLGRDQYAILWVRHEHAGHHELHFLTPRVELATGKSLNIAPPTQERYALSDTFRDMINAEYGLADPDDPARAQAVSLPNHLAKLMKAEERTGKIKREDIREVITVHVTEQVLAGQITDRQGIETYLTEQGYTITRSGKDYISVSGASEGGNIRLKGGIYSQGRFDAVRASMAHSGPILDKPDPERAAVSAADLKRLVDARAEFHRQRYPDPLRDDDGQERLHPDLGQYLEGQLGEDALVPTPEDMAEAPSMQRRIETYDAITNEPPQPARRQRGYL